MKYIDAEKLIAEIERLKEETPIGICEYDKGEENGRYEVLNHLLSTITSLQQEQPEVDLEKELNRWRHKHFKGKRDNDYAGEYLERKSQLDLVRHFYELGFNARKEEKI